MKYIASLSFGKDSLAMCLKLIELGYPLDEIIFYKNGAEFPCILKLCERFKKLCGEKKIKFTVLEPETPFFWNMLEREVHKRDGSIQRGYLVCGNTCRWGTRQKLDTIERYYKENFPPEEAIAEFVGIAADEKHRIDRKRNGNRVKIYPLIEWGMTERSCLNYIRSEGWLHEEENGVDLYDILDRVSCWCCGNKNLKELKAIYKYLPDTWEKLKDLQNKLDMPFKNGKTIHQLEERFKNEDAQMSFLDAM